MKRKERAKEKFQEEYEECVLCHKKMHIRVSQPVCIRKFYIEGGGQLCKNCYQNVYLNRSPS